MCTAPASSAHEEYTTQCPHGQWMACFETHMHMAPQCTAPRLEQVLFSNVVVFAPCIATHASSKQLCQMSCNSQSSCCGLGDARRGACQAAGALTAADTCLQPTIQMTTPRMHYHKSNLAQMARATRPAAACREECACTPASDSTHQADVTVQAEECFSFLRHCTVSGSRPHLRHGGTAQPLAYMHQPVWQPAAALGSMAQTRMDPGEAMLQPTGGVP